MKRYEIFCSIVDNFGDIGVCWRLAKQLNTEHGIAIRLWIDDLAVAHDIITALNPTLRIQTIANITICLWDQDSRFDDLQDVIIEAFGCDLPDQVTSSMTAAHVWINLEYLSAEPWVAEFHARHSQRSGLTRHFFFPGFTEHTGGLLREQDIVEKNRRVSDDQALQSSFFRQFGLMCDHDDALAVSLFCYPHAPILDILTAMAHAGRKIVCYVPATGILSAIAAYFGKAGISPGTQLSHGDMTLHVLPFLTQDDYDILLASCDINFVRGEDSWIRAIWAGKPFIWQPYRQEEAAHMAKLSAFLDRFYAGCDDAAKAAIYAMHVAWVTSAIDAAVWQDYLQRLSSVTACTAQRASWQASQPDLATNLVIYIEKLQHNHI